MLHDVVNQEHITIIDYVDDWKQAIQIGVDVLIKDQCVHQQYAHAIVKNIERYGSNFMISPYIVLPHARPEQGVIQNAVSILLLKKPCYFLNANMPIKLVMIMAAKDSRSHLHLLRDISSVLSDNKRIKEIIGSKSKEEVVRYMFYDQQRM